MNCGAIVSKDRGFLSSAYCSDWQCCLVFLLFIRYWGLFYRVRWQWHEADHTPSFSAEVKTV